MSVEQSQSEVIVEQQKTIAILGASNAALSNMVTQMWKEIAELRGQVSNMEKAAMATAVSHAQSTSTAPAATAYNACGLVDVENPNIGILEKGLLLQRMVILEEASGVMKVSNDKLVEKMTQMEETTVKQRTVIEELAASNVKLTCQINGLYMLDREVKQMVAVNQRSCGELRESTFSTASSATESTSSATKTAPPCTMSTSANHSHSVPTPASSIVSEEEVSGPSSTKTTVAATGTSSSSHATTQTSSAPTSAPVISDEHREALSKKLYDAARAGNIKKIRQLVAKGANFEYRSIDGNTALHEAAGYGHVDVLKALLELGAPLEVQGGDGNTPLHCAAWNVQEYCVNQLLLAGANVHARDKDGCTPLHDAVEKESRSIVEMLIVAGANRRAKDNTGLTPKQYAQNDTFRALL